MGEGILRAALPGVVVASAGVGALIGNPADATALELMTARGIDIGEHRARQITQAICQQSELILVMDNEQRRYIETRYPFTRGRVFRLGDAERQDIPDPYRRGQTAFENALERIDAGARSWTERIKKFS